MPSFIIFSNEKKEELNALFIKHTVDGKPINKDLEKEIREVLFNNKDLENLENNKIDSDLKKLIIKLVLQKQPQELITFIREIMSNRQELKQKQEEEKLKAKPALPDKSNRETLENALKSVGITPKYSNGIILKKFKELPPLPSREGRPKLNEALFEINLDKFIKNIINDPHLDKKNKKAINNAINQVMNAINEYKNKISDEKLIQKKEYFIGEINKMSEGLSTVNKSSGSFAEKKKKKEEIIDNFFVVIENFFKNLAKEFGKAFLDFGNYLSDILPRSNIVINTEDHGGEKVNAHGDLEEVAKLTIEKMSENGYIPNQDDSHEIIKKFQENLDNITNSNTSKYSENKKFYKTIVNSALKQLAESKWDYYPYSKYCNKKTTFTDRQLLAAAIKMIEQLKTPEEQLQYSKLLAENLFEAERAFNFENGGEKSALDPTVKSQPSCTGGRVSRFLQTPGILFLEHPELLNKDVEKKITAPVRKLSLEMIGNIVKPMAYEQYKKLSATDQKNFDKALKTDEEERSEEDNILIQKFCDDVFKQLSQERGNELPDDEKNIKEIINVVIPCLTDQQQPYDEKVEKFELEMAF